jgi:hypothetical protein
MFIWFLLALLNALAVALNVWTGVTYGFDFLTYACIALSASVTIWCLMKAAVSS